jgi:hypothetical protein
MLWKTKWGLGIDFELQLLRLSVVAQSYSAILNSRNFGQLQVDAAKPAAAGAAKPSGAQPDCACGKHTPKATQAPKPAQPHAEEPPPAGSIPYLAMVAHSTSRMKLHDEVRTVLQRQFTTRKR